MSLDSFIKSLLYQKPLLNVRSDTGLEYIVRKVTDDRVACDAVG